MQTSISRIKKVQKLWDTSYLVVEGKVEKRLEGLAKCCGDACHKTHHCKSAKLRYYRTGK